MATNQDLQKDIDTLAEMNKYVKKLKDGTDWAALDMLETLIVDWWEELELELKERKKK